MHIRSASLPVVVYNSLDCFSASNPGDNRLIDSCLIAQVCTISIARVAQAFSHAKVTLAGFRNAKIIISSRLAVCLDLDQLFQQKPHKTMDPLRLLTRSTKFSKQQSGPPQQQIPSRGPAANPQLYDDASGTTNSSRKRKRGDLGTNGTHDVAPGLDFFGGSFAQNAPAKESAKISHEDGSGGPEEEVADGGVEVAQHAMSREECKQILGRHKLKITLLQTPATGGKDQAMSKKKKKVSKTAETPAKTRAQMLHPVPATNFQRLRQRFNLSKALAQNIQDQGYRTTTEVQLGALPLLLGTRAHLISTLDTAESEENEHTYDESNESPLDIDLLTVAPTGSGKTLAFMIPLIHSLLHARRRQNPTTNGPQAIVLAPTKELSSQIANEGRKLAQNTGIKITNVRKGMHLSKERTVQSDGEGKEIPPVKADILVSTPAALLNAIGDVKEHTSSLANIRFLVLDEADVLLDPLFREQTLGVWIVLNHPRLRVGFWSATMGSNIEELVKTAIQARKDRLSESEGASVEEAPLVRLVVGLKDSAVPNIDHQLIYAASEQGKLMALRQLLHPTSTGADKQPVLRAPFLVFTQTIERAVALHSELMYDIPPEAGGISRIAVLHSDLSETARDGVMTRFRKGEVWILITTDLLSRGVDFRGVNGVVNYDVPNSAAAYVHRVGRTGRAGREGGVALTYYTDEDVASIKTVANMIAASQKQRGGADAKKGVQQWLLDALPTPSKRDKQQLKKRGLEARRSTAGKDAKAGAVKTRISTKSGYIRKMENNRKGAIAARQAGPADAAADSDGGESFGGFEE